MSLRRMRDCVLLSPFIKILKPRELIGNKSQKKSLTELKVNAIVDGQSTLPLLPLQGIIFPGRQMKIKRCKRLSSIVTNKNLSLKKIRSGGSTGAMSPRDWIGVVRLCNALLVGIVSSFQRKLEESLMRIGSHLRLPPPPPRWPAEGSLVLRMKHSLTPFLNQRFLQTIGLIGRTCPLWWASRGTPISAGSDTLDSYWLK